MFTTAQANGHKPSPDETPYDGDERRPSLADIVREETQNGRLIIRFLVSAMEGRLEDSKPCHRLDAARLLIKAGVEEAQTFIDEHSTPYGRRSDRWPVEHDSPSRLREELAEIVRQETDGGRTPVRFLVDVMQGNHDGFKPHHRIAAAKELLRRGFDDAPDDDDDYYYDDTDDYQPPAMRRPCNKLDSDSIRAQYEAGLQADDDYDDEEEEDDDASDPVDPGAENEAPPPDTIGLACDETGVLGTGPTPDLPDYSEEPRPIGLSKWERKAMRKGIDLGWDCGIPP